MFNTAFLLFTLTVFHSRNRFRQEYGLPPQP